MAIKYKACIFDNNDIITRIILEIVRCHSMPAYALYQTNNLPNRCEVIKQNIQRFLTERDALLMQIGGEDCDNR